MSAVDDRRALTRDRLTRYTGRAWIAYAGAPALLIAYGLAHLADGLDGWYGPGPAWTIGHACFLGAMLLFAVAVLALRRAAAAGAPRRIATAATVAALLGLVVFVRGIVVDLIVGLRGADRPDMDRIYPRYDRWPGGLPRGLVDALQNVGPPLFIVGLLTLTTLLAVARPRRLSWWSPVLTAAGFVALSADLDLLPVGGAALLAALAPMYARRPGPS